MTDNEQADLLFSDAVYRVWQKHTNFVAMVMDGHRQIAEKTPGVDPFVSACNMECGFDAEPGSAKHTKARLQMVEALLHVWYRVEPDIQSAVMDAVREIAILNDVDELTAMMTAGQVIDRARGAGTAVSEQIAASKVKLETQRLKREHLTRDRTRERLEREMRRA